MIPGRTHFIGVGGAGMSAVAWLLASRGADVSGSDAHDGPYVSALLDNGVAVTIGHSAALVDGAARVVVSSAIRDANPELAAARAAGIPVLHRSEALQVVLDDKREVAVAGAHGKTTTSAMVAHALRGAGIDPTFAIGAPVLGVSGAVGGARLGLSDVAVIEADESDGSFLNYRPEIAVITNVEADHLDHWGTARAVEDAFGAFAALARTLVVCADDPAAARVGSLAAERGQRVLTYGEAEGADARLTARGVIYEGGTHPLEVPQPGRHNRLNAAGAWLAAVEAGADAGTAAAALASYAGTGRRYELRGVADRVRVIDDYAHHPTEIRALLDAARLAEKGRLVVVFQPHLYSRTRLLAPEFATALTIPDGTTIVCGVYGAREDPEPGVGPRTITDLIEAGGGHATAVEDLRDAARLAVDAARPGDTILTVGAGSVTDAASWILDALAAREGR